MYGLRVRLACKNQNRRSKFKPVSGGLREPGSYGPWGGSGPPPSSLLPASHLPSPSSSSLLPPPSSPPSQNGNCFFPGCLELVSSQGNNVSPQLRQALPPGISLQWRNTPPARPFQRWDTPRACLGTGQRGTRPETHKCKQKQKQKRDGKTRGWGGPSGSGSSPNSCLHLPVRLEQITSFSEPIFFHLLSIKIDLLRIKIEQNSKGINLESSLFQRCHFLCSKIFLNSLFFFFPF